MPQEFRQQHAGLGIANDLVISEMEPFGPAAVLNSSPGAFL